MKYNLDIIRGSRYIKSFIYKDSTKTPIDITGLSARMHIRERPNSSNFELELTSGNGLIQLVAPDGQITINLGATDTELLTIDSGVYDLELYDPADVDVVDTILEGGVTVRDAITR